MALDEALAVSVRHGSSPPVLRIYGWSAPSLTLGAFQRPDGINIAFCRNNNVPVIRRLTGGRAVLHGDELTYSVSARNESGFSGRLMDVYLKIGAAFHLCFITLGLDCRIKDSVERGTVLIRNPSCFESQSTGEISHAGQKLIGSAQKRWTDAFMQQGSIPFSVDSRILSGIFGEKETQERPVGLRGFIPDINAEILKGHLAASFEETFKIRLSYSLPSQEELGLAERFESERYPDLAGSREEKPGNRCDNRKETVSPPSLLSHTIARPVI